MKNITNFIRELNGYRLLFLPDHPRAMKGGNWDGYVYEHIVVAMKSICRSLREDEVVHHLDGNRSNNRAENLLVLINSQHMRLHCWLNAGAPGLESHQENGMNSLKTKSKLPTYCQICGVTLQNNQLYYCSSICASNAHRKVERPTIKQLKEDISSMSLLKVGKKYGVSDNAIRKWMKSYGIDKSTMSQAEGTLSEGAETSGEVKSS